MSEEILQRIPHDYTPPQFRTIEITEERGPWQMDPLQQFALYRLCPCNTMYSIVGFVKETGKFPETWSAYTSSDCGLFERKIGTFFERNARQQAFHCLMAA